jgi:hypothetical protein
MFQTFDFRLPTSDLNPPPPKQTRPYTVSPPSGARMKGRPPYWRKNVGRACVQRLLVPNLPHNANAAHLRQYNFM